MRELLQRITFGLILLAAPMACQTEGIVEEVDVPVEAGVDVDDPDMLAEPDLHSELPDADMESPDADAALGPDMPQDIQPDEPGLPVCQPELAWSNVAEAYQVHYGESSLYLSPTGELVALQSGMAREFFDPGTGHSKGTDPNGPAAGLEGDWTLNVRVGEAGVLVSAADAAMEAEIIEMPAASDPELTWLSGGASAVSADSSLVAAVACWRSVGGTGSQAVLGVWQMPAKVLLRSVELGQECQGSYWLDAPTVLFAGSYVVARLPGSGRVHVVGVKSPVHQQVDLAQGQVPAARLGDELVGYEPLLSPVVRLAVSPDGGRLASVTHDGKLRIHLLPSLDETGPTIQAGFAGINMATYGPSMASPLAWSKDGRLLAHMSDQGTTSVSRVDTGEVVFRVENPPTESEMAGPDPLNPPIAFLFLGPEPSLIVAHEFGRQKWFCDTARKLAEVHFRFQQDWSRLSETPPVGLGCREEKMSQATNVDHYQRILRVLMYIQRHLDEELSLDALAEVACFSPYHFHRVFAALVGESLMAHVRRLRLERAAFRLRVTKDPVIRIAMEAGYETHEAFTRAFRASFGESPSGFRRKGHFLSTGSSGRVHFGHEAEGLEFDPLTYGGIQMEIRIENWNPKCVAFVRHVGPYAECGRAWEALCGWAGPKGLLGGTPWVAGVSYDDPAITPPEQLRYDACLAVPDHVQGEGPVGVQTIEGGVYAVVTHKGPYENFHQTYSYLYAKGLPEKGLTFRDAPCVEVYLNDPDTTPPEDLLTNICIPARRLG